ncbi:patatin-like phospholipase family protein [Ferruginibacter sp. SUN106]|uniref:patatin-like phospholipase family protein n=1 Tax=Ferruginibacter sp. SUN106 TaxID=2978348 RepID=UPI003D36324D
MKKLIAVLLFPALCFAQKKYDYKNLVLEGGGVRGLAYAGVFSVLEEKNILQHIENVGGSSAGAIAGMMVSIGYSAEEIDSLMIELPIQKFNDGKGGVVGKYKRFKNAYGIYKGEEFEKWLQQLVAHKTGKPLLTFGQLHQLHLNNNNYKDLYCTGTNLSKQQLEIFSYVTAPDMPVTLAVRVSSTIPIYFEPVALNNNLKKIKKSDSSSFVNFYVDGGMLCNYPINFFDTSESNLNPLLSDKVRFNTQTIGIKLERPQQIDSLNNNNTQIPAYDINKLSEYFSALVNLLMETINRRYPNLENEKGRTIYVSQGNISSKIKKTKQQDKLLLYNNGVKAAKDFFSKQNK